MNCVDRLMQRFGIDRQQAIDISSEVMEQINRLEARQRGNISDLSKQIKDALAKGAQREMIEALAKKRALQLSYAKRMDLFRLATDSFKGREWEALPAILAGSQRNLRGARKSVDASQTALRGYYIGGLISDLEALGNGDHLKMLNRGVFDGDIARALWSIDNQNAPAFQGPKEAMDLAQVIHKWQEKAREDANRAGAWIGKEEGYIVRQSHDRQKMRGAGEEKWVNDIYDKLDWDRTGDGKLTTEKKRKKFLSEAYKNLTLAREWRRSKNDFLADSRIIGDRAARMSHERVLHFLNADKWLAYNNAYGRGNLREAVVYGLSRMANNTALMRVLGPNPHGTLEAVSDMLMAAYRKAGDRRGVDKLNAVQRRTENIMKEVDGTINAEAGDHPTLAAVGRVTRALTSMTRLGGAMLSSFSDAPLFAEELSYQGYNWFTAIAEGLRMMLTGRGTAEQKRILSSIGVFVDTMAGDIVARASGAEDGPGTLSRMQAWFFKLNGLSWWTNSWRKAAGLMMAHDLALDKVNPWDALSMQRRRVLEQYNIGAEEWELMRKGDTRAADGREYFTPDALDTVSDADIAAYLAAKGVQNVTDIRISDTRAEMADRLRTMLRDRINYAVLEPDARTRSLLRQGTSVGTWVGEAMRWATQFKSFPAVYAQRTLGRAFYGRRGESKAAIAMSMARLIAMTTLFGYVSMATKDMFKGKEPRSPKDKKTWLAAFVQGGGAGIYGDFLLGDYNRFGGGFVETLAGPTLGNLGDLARIWTQMREGDSYGQGLARWIQNNIPGNSLFYVRSALDYLIMYNIYDMMKPGYFRRMQKRVKRENNQKFFMRPVTKKDWKKLYNTAIGN